MFVLTGCNPGETNTSPIGITLSASAEESKEDSKKDDEEAKKSFSSDIDLFSYDTVHSIILDISEDEFEKMKEDYLETGEKEYFKTDITIDGVKIKNVGVRLKGNSTISSTVGGGLGGKGSRSGMPGGPGNFEIPDIDELDLSQITIPDFIELPDDWDVLSETAQKDVLKAFFETVELPESPFGRGGPGGRGAPDFGDDEEGEKRGMNMVYGGMPGLLVKLNEYKKGQNYQGHEEIALRTGKDASLLAEPVSYSIHKAMGQIAPEVSYADVQIAGKNVAYVMTEHIDEEYAEKYFPDEEGTLYKSENFVSLDYRGDNLEDYEDTFKQKTNKKDDDGAALIAFLKFINEASDEEFLAKIEDYLAVEPLLKMMALDEILQNSDSFGGAGSNYYIFYSTTNDIIHIITWDHNLALGGMGGFGDGGPMGERDGIPGFGEGAPMGERGGIPGFGGEDNEQMEVVQWLMRGGFDQDSTEERDDRGGRGGFGMKNDNILKKRLLATERFSEQYDALYDEIFETIKSEQLGENFIEAFATSFREYNAKHQLIDEEEYNTAVEGKKEFFRTLGTETEPKPNDNLATSQEEEEQNQPQISVNLERNYLLEAY